MSRHEEPLFGFTIIELLLVIAIAGMILAVSIPGFSSQRRRAAVRAAASELRAVFHVARSRALARNANTAIKFIDEGGAWTYAIYDDGDRDGVRNDDIRRGTDPLVQEPRRLGVSNLATISLPPFTIVDPDGDKLPPDRSPVQFNKSTLCSFSPLGQATPGTIYLTDHAGEIFAVRVYGPTAKMKLIRYDAKRKRWEGR